MESWDLHKFALPVYLVLAVLAVWTSVQRRSWYVHGLIMWVVGSVLTAVWWNAGTESGTLDSLTRLLEVAAESAVAVALPLIPAMVAVILPKSRRTIFWRIVAWCSSLIIAFYSAITGLVVHCWITGDCL